MSTVTKTNLDESNKSLKAKASNYRLYMDNIEAGPSDKINNTIETRATKRLYAFVSAYQKVIELKGFDGNRKEDKDVFANVLDAVKELDDKFLNIPSDIQSNTNDNLNLSNSKDIDKRLNHVKNGIEKCLGYIKHHPIKQPSPESFPF